MSAGNAKDDPCVECEISLCKLRNGAFCTGLTADERTRLNAIARQRQFSKGATILAEGDEPTVVGNVVEGVLKLQKSQHDGRQQIVGLLVPTDMFGRVFTGTSEFSIEAATDVTLCCFDKRRFEALVMEIPALEHQVMLAILDELDSAREWITLLGGQTVTQKLANFLLILCRRWPNVSCGLAPNSRNVEIHMPISRADMAQYLGTTVETISRTVQSLDREGILRVITPSQFEVTDLPQLIALSGNDDFDPASIVECVKNAS